MLRHPGWFLAAALLAVTAACGRSETRPAHENPTLLHERIWIEKRPEKPNQIIHAFAVPSEIEPFGLFAHASAYRATTELFQYKKTRDRMSLRFPQDGREAEMKFHLERCQSDIPEADLCLFLDSNPWDGPRRYYGIKKGRAKEILPALAQVLR
jgi:hypothetical protein